MSVVLLTLDTKAPKVKLSAVEQIDPPAEWDILLVADEPLGGARLALVDASGVAAPVGYESLDDRTLRVLVPSPGVSRGPAVLQGDVWDEVHNAVAVVATVYVRRAEPMVGAWLTVEKGFEVSMDPGAAFDVAITIERAFDADLTTGRILEGEITIERAFDAKLEMDNA